MGLNKIKLTTLFFLSFMSLSGQTYFESGYVVTLKNDTLYGKIKDRKTGAFPELYTKIRFKKEGSIFKKKYRPKEIIAYKAGERIYESIEIETVTRFLKTHYMLSSTSEKSFLRVIQKGALNYYHWEYMDAESGYIDYIPLFHKKGETEMARATQGILGLKKKKLAEYFNDCPELVRKIEDKEIRTPEEILEIYAVLCGEN